MNSIKRGDIYMANLGQNIGSVQSGYRPVLIIQNNIGNKESPTVEIVPITSKKENKWYMPTHVRIGQNKLLSKDSFILCEQIQTIDKCQLDKRIGPLKRRKLLEVNVAVAASVIPGMVEYLCKRYDIKNRTVDDEFKMK